MDYKKTLMWKEINQVLGNFSKIYEKNEKIMTELVSVIKEGNATNFVTAARGASENAIVFFKYMLEINSNYTVGISAPSVVTLYRGKVNYSNSIVIGCSESGLAEDVLEVIKKGNEQGAITIAVTNEENSPVAKSAKYTLLCNVGKEEGVVATKTFNAQLYLLLWLALALSNKRLDIKLLKNLDSELLGVVSQVDELTTKYTEQFKDIQNGFVLSRGITYPIAKEAELILEESALLQMKGYAGSNFYHGPITLLSKDTPVIMFCAKNDGDEELQSIVRADQLKCLEKVLTLGAPVLLVTNDCILTGKSKLCNDALINFSLPEEFSMFAFSIFIQMFACKIACKKGLDPDNPRVLPKTTITK